MLYQKKLLIVWCMLLQLGCIQAFDRQLKVLHMTFHEGCKNDFEDVARELNLDVTSWYVQALPPGFWEGIVAGNEIYNVSHRRAERVWKRHRAFFEQFDLIVTSDTVPLSRIFLQNNWQKPLIIWVCNRFDYSHDIGGEDRFPDRAYYELIKRATKMKNVRIISYTPFEYEYARRRGIDFGTLTIKPLGKKEVEFSPEQSRIPLSVTKEDTLFVFPRLSTEQINQVLGQCATHDIKAWSGVYNGPEDLKGFKGVIFFPYNFSNLALFENIQRGIVHFVPTQDFLVRLGGQGIVRSEMHGNLAWCEWYLPMYNDYFIFFDSWQELHDKAQQLDYEAMRQKVRTFAQNHRLQMVTAWQQVVNELMN